MGRIRYLGVVLYDADKIEEAASAPDEGDLYESQMSIFLDPNNPEVQKQALADGIPHAWLESAKRSPVWKLAMEYKVAFPLHPEYRTLPMVWYVPPLSPITSAAPGWITSIVIAALGALSKDFNVSSTQAQVNQATQAAKP